MIVKQIEILLLLSLTFLKIPPSLAAVTEILSRKPIQNKTDERDTKIVGGYKCSINDYPFLVSLRHPNADQHFCAGTLLSEFWILSALHCLQKRCHNAIEVIAGSNYAKNVQAWSKDAFQISTISSCYFYPIVKDEEFDIALARLKKPILRGDNVAYVSLPFNLPNDQTSLVDICSNATVTGWGLQYASNMYQEPLTIPVAPYDSHLQCIHLPVISQDECTAKSYSTILPSFFCTYRPMTDACMGDSGGPLICNGHQYGIVSYGFGCAFEEFPGVYTNVLYFKNFILTTMESPFIHEKSFASSIRITAELSLVLVILVSQLYILH